MSQDLDRDAWERRWEQVVRDHGDAIARRPPSPRLVEAAEALVPGRALDAGCGHGAEALWLAARGWDVTAVDFSATALAQARSTAKALGVGGVAWVEADLGAWEPSTAAYDLVSSLYVHVAGSVEEMVRRLSSGVAPGGTLLLVGHLPLDPDTGAATPAAGQNQVTVESALAALDPRGWEVSLAAELPRAAAGTGVDAVVQARRRP